MRETELLGDVVATVVPAMSTMRSEAAKGIDLLAIRVDVMVRIAEAAL